MWSFPGAQDTPRQSGAGWYHTWSVHRPPGIAASGGADFVPVIRGAASVTPQGRAFRTAP